MLFNFTGRVCKKALDTEIIAVFYIYLWSLTSNFTISSLKILNLNCWNKSGNAKMCFQFAYVTFTFLCKFVGDQKDYRFSSTQSIFLMVIIQSSYFSQ